MIHIDFNTSQLVTMYLEPSLVSPTYLISLINLNTRERLNFIAPESSGVSDLLQFTIIEVGDGSQNLLTGRIMISDFGMHTMEVYEQTSTTNLDETLATLLGDDELYAHKVFVYDNPPLRDDILPPVLGCTLSVIVTGNDPTTSGGSDGDATATPSGGQGNITYLWDDGLAQTTPTATNLVEGTYICMVTDDIVPLCTDSDFVVLEDDTSCTISVVVSVTPETEIDANNGTANATPSGGQGNLTYAWTGPDSFTSTDQNIIDLAPGLYTVIVTDDILVGCTATDNGTVDESTAELFAANLTGANYLSSSDAFFDKGDTNWAFEGWIFIDNDDTNFFWTKWESAGNQRSYYLFIAPDGLMKWRISANGTTFTTVVSTVTMTQGYHYVMTFHDAGNNTIGISVDDETIVTAPHATGVFSSSTDFKIGLQSSGNFGTHRIDSFGGYTKVLTQGQNTTLFNNDDGQAFEDMDQGSLGVFYKMNVASGPRESEIGNIDLTDNSSVGRETGKVLD